MGLAYDRHDRFRVDRTARDGRREPGHVAGIRKAKPMDARDPQFPGQYPLSASSRAEAGDGQGHFAREGSVGPCGLRVIAGRRRRSAIVRSARVERTGLAVRGFG